MWIFTKNGFFSAVQHNSNADLIHVRARFKGDLERLCNHYKVESAIEHTPRNDYPYRMNVSRDKWSEIVASEAMDIDYDNFKNAVHDGTLRDSAYFGCWHSLSKYQME